jgi:hypothetical protein
MRRQGQAHRARPALDLFLPDVSAAMMQAQSAAGERADRLGQVGEICAFRLVCKATR